MLTIFNEPSDIEDGITRIEFNISDMKVTLNLIIANQAAQGDATAADGNSIRFVNKPCPIKGEIRPRFKYDYLLRAFCSISQHRLCSICHGN